MIWLIAAGAAAWYVLAWAVVRYRLDWVNRPLRFGGFGGVYAGSPPDKALLWITSPMVLPLLLLYFAVASLLVGVSLLFPEES